MSKSPSSRRPQKSARTRSHSRNSAGESRGSPSRSRNLGHSQNFITDEACIRRLLAHVRPGGVDTIVEIGPGRGALTAPLAKLASRVLAVEADVRLALELVRRFSRQPEIAIVHGDFLDFPLPARPFIVVANIPFDRTAEIMRKLTGEESGLRAAYLVMQREAAQKYCGESGAPVTLQSLLLGLEFSVKTLCKVPRGCFAPRPGVDASFAVFRKRKIPLLGEPSASVFRDLLAYLFPRCKPDVAAGLRRVFSLEQMKELCAAAGIEAARKLSDVALVDWLEVHEAFEFCATEEARERIRGAYRRLLAEQAGLSKRHRSTTRM